MSTWSLFQALLLNYVVCIHNCLLTAGLVERFFFPHLSLFGIETALIFVLINYLPIKKKKEIMYQLKWAKNVNKQYKCPINMKISIGFNKGSLNGNI